MMNKIILSVVMFAVPVLMLVVSAQSAPTNHIPARITWAYNVTNCTPSEVQSFCDRGDENFGLPLSGTTISNLLTVYKGGTTNGAMWYVGTTFTNQMSKDGFNCGTARVDVIRSGLNSNQFVIGVHAYTNAFTNWLWQTHNLGLATTTNAP
jgi:hypothetical protein